MEKSLGRTLKDASQKARGRVPLRYDFEVVPRTVDDLPSGVSVCSVAWEKGDRISFTDAVQVDPSTSSASFHQKMCQNVTIYRENNVFLAKEYTFKIQTLTSSRHSGNASRKTIAKAKLDLSQFCTNSAQAAEHQYSLKLQPVGRLHLAIKTQWLQHVKQTPISDSVTDTHTEFGSTEDLFGTCDSFNRGSYTWAAGARRTSDSSNSDISSSSSAYALGNGSDHHNTLPSFVEPQPYPGIASSNPVTSSSTPGKLGHRRTSSGPFATPILEVPETVEQAETGQASKPPTASDPSPRPGTPAGAVAAGGGGCDRGNVGEGPSTTASGVWSSLKTTVNAGLGSLKDLVPGPDQEGRSAAAAVPAAGEGMGRSLSSQLPSWMWPVGRNAVKEMRTDDIMQAIQSGSDIWKLQMLARGLLAERNDWRYRATQAERESLGKDERLAAQQKQLEAASRRCEMLQREAAQLKESGWINELKLINELMRAQERHRQVAAKLTKLESEHERLLHEQWVGQQAAGQGWPTGSEQ